MHWHAIHGHRAHGDDWPYGDPIHGHGSDRQNWPYGDTIHGYRPDGRNRLHGCLYGDGPDGRNWLHGRSIKCHGSNRFGRNKRCKWGRIHRQHLAYWRGINRKYGAHRTVPYRVYGQYRRYRVYGSRRAYR